MKYQQVTKFFIPYDYITKLESLGYEKPFTSQQIERVTGKKINTQNMELPEHTAKEIMFSNAINMKYSGKKRFAINADQKTKNISTIVTCNFESFTGNFNRETIERFINKHWDSFKNNNYYFVGEATVNRKIFTLSIGI